MNITPLAIAMWDFSWLERRWPGAGYEDWDKVLDELAERGYNAVRIDAYPHLLAENPMKAISTGQWVAMATSNFCGPQFVGMWRDIAWHERLTHLIRCSQVNEDLRNNPQAQKLFQRI